MTRRVSLLLGVALIVGLIGLIPWWMGRNAEPNYQTTPVDRGTIAAKVTASGNLSALVTVQVGSQVSGRILQLDADFNSQVHKGQVLAKLDPQLFVAALNQARANDLAARSNLTKSQVQAAEANRQLARTKLLADRKLIALADLDAAQANADTAKAQVEASRAAVAQAEASLHQAEVNLGYTTIVSPIDGVVISRNIDVGQTVAASLQAPILFLIAQDLRKLQVDASVSESDIGKLKSGMKAEFTVDAYPDQQFEGTVRQIRSAPQTVQNVVTYETIIDVDNADLKLKPGMTANVTLIYDERDGALRVPNAALRFRPAGWTGGGRHRAQGAKSQGNQGQPAVAGQDPGGQGAGKGQDAQGDDQGRRRRAFDPSRKTLWVLRNGKADPVRIKTGLTDGSYTEVVSGALNEGDPVITDAGTPGASAPPRQQGMPGMGPMGGMQGGGKHGRHGGF